MTRLAALSPYPIPPSLNGRKVTNLGDGFILRGIERQLRQTFDAEKVFSPRVPPDEASRESMRSADLVVLAGANQLNDRYTVWPGLTAGEIAQQGWKFVPFGIGVHGEPGFNDLMGHETKAVLEQVHERISFSSWRCPMTVAYLRASLPHLAERFLMTGCPVLYDAPLLDSARFAHAEDSVAVTATERGEFWNRETALIDIVARRFPKARRYFVVHQNFSPPTWGEALRHRLLRRGADTLANRVEGLRAYARSRGFKPVVMTDADACIRFYEQVDLHVGSRLHAHLLFLSRNKRSFLVPVDNRSVGMAQFLGFPLPLPEALHRHWDFDFEIVRRNAREAYRSMQTFVRSLPS